MKPLEGIKVVDFIQAHAGSLATMILADFGAEVIKIERARVGDMARYWVPMKDDNSAYYTYLNRGKKSIGLNASTDEGREIIFRLIKDADIVCENFKYGSMERMGLSYEEIKKVNPNIIYASLNAFGQTGPMKNVFGLDLQMQAMSGFMDRTGFPDGPPTKAGPAMGDQLSGTYMATAMNLVLIHKKKTGEGQRIDISILAGANKEGKKGIFELANGGTLFLDEIGELPYDLQAKFLHVLQEEEVFPVGGTKPIKLDIRIICATNCDLERMTETRRFRKDLFHRINTFDVTIPPLRKDERILKF